MLTDNKLAQCPHLTVTMVNRLVHGTLTCQQEFRNIYQCEFQARALGFSTIEKQLWLSLKIILVCSSSEMNWLELLKQNLNCCIMHIQNPSLNLKDLTFRWRIWTLIFTIWIWWFCLWFVLFEKPMLWDITLFPIWDRLNMKNNQKISWHFSKSELWYLVLRNHPRLILKISTSSI